MAMRLLAILTLLFLLGACGGSGYRSSGSGGKYYSNDGPPANDQGSRTIADAVPRVEPRSRRGNPKSYVVFGKRYHVMDSSKGYVKRGIASWYGKKFHGRETSSGEVYDMHAMTAAHKTLPIPAYVEVENLRTGKTIIVRVNDRGPFHAGRIIDLSYAAAQKLGVATKGTGLVEVRAIDPHTWKPGQKNQRVKTAAAPHDNPRIYLQLGAFSVQSNAEKMVNAVISKVVPDVFVSTGRHRGQTVYRVRIGPLATVKLVDDMIDRLGRHGYTDFYPVIE